jgi:hypothetical protein
MRRATKIERRSEMLKLLTWPFWLPLYVLGELGKAAGNKNAGWRVEDNNVLFGKPYPKGKKFYDPASPFDESDE